METPGPSPCRSKADACQCSQCAHAVRTYPHHRCAHDTSSLHQRQRAWTESDLNTIRLSGDPSVLMDEEEDYEEEESFNPTPYPHQVGGHGQISMTSAGRLLKPLYEKELRFYRYIHSDSLAPSLRWLRHTTPKFYGQSVLSSSYTFPGHVCKHHQHDHRNHYNPECPAALSQCDQLAWRDHSTFVHNMSPWALALRTRALYKLQSEKQKNAQKSKDTDTNTRPRPSITLEDINESFVYPCVMDCKIGTRHYDDDATEEKRRKQDEKCAKTTSKKYGIRFTGMQSYKRKLAAASRCSITSDSFERGVFEFRDKYHGRKVTEADLVPEAKWFFHDGVRVRVECIKEILNKLYHIRKCVLQQTHFKFYSSSLLIVYEGKPDVVKVDVRMIDFAHTQWKVKEERDYDEHDEGYILGITNLIKLLERVTKDEEQNQ